MVSWRLRNWLITRAPIGVCEASGYCGESLEGEWWMPMPWQKHAAHAWRANWPFTERFGCGDRGWK